MGDWEGKRGRIFLKEVLAMRGANPRLCFFSNKHVVAAPNGFVMLRKRVRVDCTQDRFLREIIVI